MTQYRHQAGNRQAHRLRAGVLTSAAACIAMLLAVPGLAQQPPTNLVAPPAVSLEEAVSIATQRRPGRVVRAVTSDDGRTHEVRILLNEGGRVVTVRIDARTGAVR